HDLLRSLRGRKGPGDLPSRDLGHDLAHRGRELQTSGHPGRVHTLETVGKLASVAGEMQAGLVQVHQLQNGTRDRALPLFPKGDRAMSDLEFAGHLPLREVESLTKGDQALGLPLSFAGRSGPGHWLDFNSLLTL